MQVANPNRAQFTKCAGYAIPYTTYFKLPPRNYANYYLELKCRWRGISIS